MLVRWWVSCRVVGIVGVVTVGVVVEIVELSIVELLVVVVSVVVNLMIVVPLCVGLVSSRLLLSRKQWIG